MQKILVAVDRSLESSFALRAACQAAGPARITPIHVFDPSDRDLSFGAGWARKSWGRESGREARERIEALVFSNRDQCPAIEEAMVMGGDPVKETAGFFWKENHDLLVIGAPFRGWGPASLENRFRQVAKREGRDMPLLVVREPGELKTVTALTNGGSSAEKALDLLIKISAHRPLDVTLIGLSREPGESESTEALDLERGLAIFREKDIKPAYYTASELGRDAILELLASSDMTVDPGVVQDRLTKSLPGFYERNCPAVLFYLEGSKE